MDGSSPRIDWIRPPPASVQPKGGRTGVHRQARAKFLVLNCSIMHKFVEKPKTARAGVMDDKIKLITGSPESPKISAQRVLAACLRRIIGADLAGLYGAANAQNTGILNHTISRFVKSVNRKI